MKTSELTNALSAITPEEGLEQRILRKVSAPAPRTMRTLRRTAAALAAAVMLLTVGAVASNPEALRISGGSRGTPDYTQLPTAAQCEEDIGFAPRLVQTFENGYTFTEGSFVNNRLETDDGKTVSRYKALALTYTKGSDTVIYHTRRTLPTDGSDRPAIAVVNDIALMYNTYTNKLVPENYQLTEADRAAQAEGVVFSWGWNAVETVEVQTLYWEQDGIHHALQQTDGALSPDELAAMAAQLIAK